MANVYFSAAMLIPESEQASPLKVGDKSASTNCACSLAVAVSVKDGSETDVSNGSKTNSGPTRSMVVKSLAKPWLGPQFKLRSETEFAPS